MREARPGVYFWQVQHPEWEPGEGWDALVTSYALDDGEQLIVVDPLRPPAELLELAARRQTVVLLTCPWHRRDAESLCLSLGLPLYVPSPDEGDPNPVTGTIYAAGDRLAVGVDAIRGLEENDLVLWIERHGAVVAGDTLIDRGEGLIFPRDWAEKSGDPEELIKPLLALLDLEVDVVLPTHGLPTDRQALARALTHF